MYRRVVKQKCVRNLFAIYVKCIMIISRNCPIESDGSDIQFWANFKLTILSIRNGECWEWNFSEWNFSTDYELRTTYFHCDNVHLSTPTYISSNWMYFSSRCIQRTINYNKYCRNWQLLLRFYRIFFLLFYFRFYLFCDQMDTDHGHQCVIKKLSGHEDYPVAKIYKK